MSIYICDQSEVSYVNDYKNKYFKCKITLSKMIVYVIRTRNTNFKTLRWMGLFWSFSHPSRYISASIDVSKWQRFILCISNAIVDYHKIPLLQLPSWTALVNDLIPLQNSIHTQDETLPFIPLMATVRFLKCEWVEQTWLNGSSKITRLNSAKTRCTINKNSVRCIT